jgi:hypothetical protein
MNAAQIKANRDQAGIMIKKILVNLENETGMFVNFIEVDSDRDDEGRNVGISEVKIQLELE